MARVEFVDTVLRALPPNTAGRKMAEALPEIAVTVWKLNANGSRPASASNIYDENGALTANPFETDEDGRAIFWADPGRYEIDFTDTKLENGAPRIDTFTIQWDAMSSAPSGILKSQLPNEGADIPPTGGGMLWFDTVAPAGWVLCDGSQYPIGATDSTYNGLYLKVGTRYNRGDETAGNFRVPDLRGRIAIMVASGIHGTLGHTNHGASTHGSNSNVAGRTLNHTHTANDHSHTINQHQHWIGGHAHTFDHGHNVSAETPTTQTGGVHDHGGNTDPRDASGTPYNFNTANSGGVNINRYQSPHSHPIGQHNGHTHTVTHGHNASGFSGSTSSRADTNTGDVSDRGTSGSSDRAMTDALLPFVNINYIVKL